MTVEETALAVEDPPTMHVDPQAAHRSPVKRSPGTDSGRIRAIDWLRGISVLVMMECHSLIGLRPDRADTPFYNWLQGYNGMVAPSFIFAAGFALALVLARAAASPDAADPQVRRRRFFRSVRRIGEVVFIAYLMRVLSRPMFSHAILWAKIDILTCIALGLFAILCISTITGTRRRLAQALMLLLAIGILLVCPFTEVYRGNAVLTGLVNGSNDSQFALIPWLAFLFIGGVAGSVMATPTTGRRRGALVFLGMLVVGLLMERGSQPLTRLYPEWADTYLLTNMGARVWKLSVALAVLSTVEWAVAKRATQSTVRPAAKSRNPVRRLIEFFSANALPAYFVHLPLLYGFPGFYWACRFHHHLNWRQYSIYVLAVITITGCVCIAANVATALFYHLTQPEPGRIHASL